MAMKSESKPLTRSNRIESVLRLSSKTTHRNAYNRPFNSAQSRRRTSVTFDIKSIKEDEYYTESNDRNLFRNPRRMSAPELPPIQDRAKNSPTQLTFHPRYIHTRSNRQSNTSDSHSGYLAKSPYSQGSSESNQSNGKGRKVTNGLISRSKTWVTPDQTPTGNNNNNSVSTLKLEAISKRNGMSSNTPRSIKNGFRSRVSSKDMSTSSGNNNTSQIKQNLKHCKSDSRIQPIENYTVNRTRKVIKRISSDQRLKDGHNNRINRVLSVEKTDSLTRNNKYTNGTVNGMRRYSSTVQLNPQKTDDYQYDEDSGSDSDKDQMIMSWLIGVESEDPENPPDPDFDYPEEPPQTDTAVHIVYEGDS